MQVIVLVIVTNCFLLFGQTGDDEIKDYIGKVNKGQREEVRQELPRLVAKYQSNPNVLYLQGRLSSDGVEAVKFYQSVVDNFPKSEWADEALYRIYQYYYAMGLYRAAELKMQQLQKDYPHSAYAHTASGIKLPEKDEIAVNLPSKEPTTVTAPETSVVQPGTAVVSSKPVATKPAGSSGQYTLQVGAFSSAANAEKQKNFFEEQGYAVEITNKVRNGRSLYLVWVGNYQTADQAKLTGRQVRTKYKIDSIVVERY